MSMMYQNRGADLTEQIGRAYKAMRARAKVELGGKVYSRQNFLCCGGCACSALHGEIESHNAKGRGLPAIGAVYYHKQDAQRMRESGEVYFGYGAYTENRDDSEALGVKIGQILVDSLRAEGLEVEWDGKILSRILAREKVSAIDCA